MTDSPGCVFGCADGQGQPIPATPGLLVCHQCDTKLAGLLTETEQLHAAISDHDELIPHSDGGRGRPGHGSRSPAIDTLLAHADPRSRPTDDLPAPALALMEQWARSIREDTSLDTPRARMLQTVPTGRVTMARELATIRFHWHWLLSQPLVTEFAEELAAVVRSLRAGTHQLARSVRVGTCPTVLDLVDLDGGEPIPMVCRTPLRLTLGQDVIRCPHCGTTWDRGRWHLLGDPHADYATLAADFDVPAGTLRRWSHEDNWAADTRGRRPLWARADAALSYARRRGQLDDVTRRVAARACR